VVRLDTSFHRRANAARDDCLCDLVDRLELEQRIPPHHFGVLCQVGLVASHPHSTDRRWLYYRLDRTVIAELWHELGQMADDADYDPTPLPCPVDEPNSAR
jgi:hypothetical protein